MIRPSTIQLWPPHVAIRFPETRWTWEFSLFAGWRGIGILVTERHMRWVGRRTPSLMKPLVPQYSRVDIIVGIGGSALHWWKWRPFRLEDRI